MDDGSFRVKRICVEPKIIESFCAEGPFVTPVKAMSELIDLDSDDVDFVPDSLPIAFLDDLIVTPHAEKTKPGPSEVVTAALKRNLNESFSGSGQVESKKRLRKVKIEKE